MAKEKTPADVELARIKANLERAKEVWRTVRWIASLTAATVMVGIIANAAVQMTDRPAWLTFALALIGVGGGPSLIAWRLWVRVSRSRASAELRAAGQGDRPNSLESEGES